MKRPKMFIAAVAVLLAIFVMLSCSESGNIVGPPESQKITPADPQMDDIGEEYKDIGWPVPPNKIDNRITDDISIEISATERDTSIISP